MLRPSQYVAGIVLEETPLLTKVSQKQGFLKASCNWKAANRQCTFKLKCNLIFKNLMFSLCHLLNIYISQIFLKQRGGGYATGYLI